MTALEWVKLTGIYLVVLMLWTLAWVSGGVFLVHQMHDRYAGDHWFNSITFDSRRLLRAGLRSWTTRCRWRTGGWWPRFWELRP